MAAQNSLNFVQSIKCLTGPENYHTWATAMKAYLQSQDLWETIEDPTGRQIPADAQKNDKARATIVLTLDPRVYRHIKNETTAKGTWDKLKNEYDDKMLIEF